MKNLFTIELAVVLISKNQAWNMARLIESVLQQTTCVSSREIVLVDSASTDQTVAVASRYPIRILRLRSDQPLTPSAGRYVGYKHTRGELVLFLDGDMELYQGWPERALQVMHERPDIAVVTGQVIHLSKTAGPGHKRPHGTTSAAAATDVTHGSGAAMYRRSVLEEVGTFNPYLYSDEEPELCIRIRHAGYGVIQLHYPITYHYSDARDALSTLVSRWRRRLYLGAGQSIRYHLGDDIVWPYLKARGYGCLPGLALIAGLISFFWSVMSGQWRSFLLWSLLLAVIVAGDAYRKRSLYRTITSLLRRTFILDGTIRGFLLTPSNPDGYPGKFDLIK